MDAEALTEARTKLKLSQEALAQKLGLSERQIRRYERGEAPIEPWLQLAIESLQGDLTDRLPPALVRKIRNATTLSDLVEIKAIFGLSEPEVLFTHDELLAKVDELFKVLYFDEDDHDAWVTVENGDGEERNHSPEEYAKHFSEKWFDQNLWTYRGRRLESRHFLKQNLLDFFSRLIFLSHDENPKSIPDDSRESHMIAIEAWLNERFRPYRINLNKAD